MNLKTDLIAAEQPEMAEPDVYDQSRMGVMRVTAQLFQQRPDIILLVLRTLDFIPHSAVPLQDPPVMEYMGHSPLFDALEQGDNMPEYRVTVRNNDDGPHVSLERLEEKRIIVPGGQ